jgi:hypothetical protein
LQLDWTEETEEADKIFSCSCSHVCDCYFVGCIYECVMIYWI